MAQSVVLADDSSNVHRLVREALEPEGYVVTCFDNGEDALRHIVVAAPDLVLADVTMPRLGGLELCARMRMEHRLRTVPVIFLVGPFDEFDEDQARKVGGFSQLPKPINPVRLANMVSEALSSGSAVTVSIEDEDEATILDQVSEVPEPEGMLRSVFHAPSDGLQDLSEIAEIQELSELSEVSVDNLKTTSQAPEPSPELPLLPPRRADTAEPIGDATGAGLSDEQLRDVTERLVRTRVVQAIHPSIIQETLRDVLRELVKEEVLKLLPSLVKEAVDARIQELEKEVHALESGS